MHQGVVAVVVVVVGLLASLATGEETTIASTSAEPFWLGKDCVRNEDGGWSLGQRYVLICKILTFVHKKTLICKILLFVHQEY